MNDHAWLTYTAEEPGRGSWEIVVDAGQQLGTAPHTTIQFVDQDGAARRSPIGIPLEVLVQLGQFAQNAIDQLAAEKRASEPDNRVPLANMISIGRATETRWVGNDMIVKETDVARWLDWRTGAEDSYRHVSETRKEIQP